MSSDAVVIGALRVTRSMTLLKTFPMVNLAKTAHNDSSEPAFFAADFVIFFLSVRLSFVLD